MFDELALINENFLKSNKNWREHAAFYHEMAQIVDSIPLTLMEDFFDTFSPTLIEIMKRGCELLKAEASCFLMTIVYYVPSDDRRSKTLQLIIKEFSRTSSSILRKAFIDICVSCLKVCSMGYFKYHFL
jgi:hypothetical protein